MNVVAVLPDGHVADVAVQLDATDSCGALLAAMHTALALPEPAGAYHVVYRQGGAVTRLHERAQDMLLDVGILGDGERVEVTVAAPADADAEVDGDGFGAFAPPPPPPVGGDDLEGGSGAEDAFSAFAPPPPPPAAGGDELGTGAPADVHDAVAAQPSGGEAVGPTPLPMPGGDAFGAFAPPPPPPPPAEDGFIVQPFSTPADGDFGAVPDAPPPPVADTLQVGVDPFGTLTSQLVGDGSDTFAAPPPQPAAADAVGTDALTATDVSPACPSRTEMLYAAVGDSEVECVKAEAEAEELARKQAEAEELARKQAEAEELARKQAEAAVTSAVTEEECGARESVGALESAVRRGHTAAEQHARALVVQAAAQRAAQSAAPPLKPSAPAEIRGAAAPSSSPAPPGCAEGCGSPVGLLGRSSAPAPASPSGAGEVAALLRSTEERVAAQLVQSEQRVAAMLQQMHAAFGAALASQQAETRALLQGVEAQTATLAQGMAALLQAQASRPGSAQGHEGQARAPEAAPQVHETLPVKAAAPPSVTAVPIIPRSVSVSASPAPSKPPGSAGNTPRPPPCTPSPVRGAPAPASCSDAAEDASPRGTPRTPAAATAAPARPAATPEDESLAAFFGELNEPGPPQVPAPPPEPAATAPPPVSPAPAPPVSPAPAPPAALVRYDELTSQGVIGKGASSTVERVVRQGGGGEVYALKVLAGGAAPAEPAALGDVRRELRVLMDLRHRHVVQVANAYYSKSGVLRLLLEYMPYGSLQRLLDARVAMAMRDVLVVGVSLMDGAAYLHRQGLAADIRPEHVLLDAGGCVKLQPPVSVAKPPPGAAPQDDPYAAPERGARPSPASDVYAAAAVLRAAVGGGGAAASAPLQEALRAGGAADPDARPSVDAMTLVLLQDLHGVDNLAAAALVNGEAAGINLHQLSPVHQQPGAAAPAGKPATASPITAHQATASPITAHQATASPITAHQGALAQLAASEPGAAALIQRVADPGCTAAEVAALAEELAAAGPAAVAGHPEGCGVLAALFAHPLLTAGAAEVLAAPLPAVAGELAASVAQSCVLISLLAAPDIPLVPGKAAVIRALSQDIIECAATDPGYAVLQLCVTAAPQGVAAIWAADLPASTSVANNLGAVALHPRAAPLLAALFAATAGDRAVAQEVRVLAAAVAELVPVLVADPHGVTVVEAVVTYVPGAQCRDAILDSVRTHLAAWARDDTAAAVVATAWHASPDGRQVLSEELLAVHDGAPLAAALAGHRVGAALVLLSLDDPAAAPRMARALQPHAAGLRQSQHGQAVAAKVAALAGPAAEPAAAAGSPLDLIFRDAAAPTPPPEPAAGEGFSSPLNESVAGDGQQQQQQRQARQKTYPRGSLQARKAPPGGKKAVTFNRAANQYISYYGMVMADQKGENLTQEDKDRMMAEELQRLISAEAEGVCEGFNGRGTKSNSSRGRRQGQGGGARRRTPTPIPDRRNTAASDASPGDLAGLSDEEIARRLQDQELSRAHGPAVDRVRAHLPADAAPTPPTRARGGSRMQASPPAAGTPARGGGGTAAASASEAPGAWLKKFFGTTSG
eukprot:TRINITY_DN678_c0_g2_i3.p1 TRINITY_DN678_c0_g2~~TRINITY_DN678_c0_g2_i3.p1  ORF type:complete len:1604 (+),score=476.79 TRINITY_DN678_c0_g2_i3:99-4814(+)